MRLRTSSSWSSIGDNKLIGCSTRLDSVGLDFQSSGHATAELQRRWFLVRARLAGLGLKVVTKLVAIGFNID